MRAQDIIDKITDDTKVDDLLVDLAEVVENENKLETRVAQLESDVESRDNTIKELKIDNHELLKKVASGIDFYGHKDKDEPHEEIKSEEEILKGFLER